MEKSKQLIKEGLIAIDLYLNGVLKKDICAKLNLTSKQLRYRIKLAKRSG